MVEKINLAIFISGRGSNMKSIIDACNNQLIHATTCIVVSDNPQAPGLKYAEQHNIKTFVFNPKEFNSKKDYENKIVQALHEKEIDLICLAGYMRLIGSILLDHFKDRIINIHPSLLPAFKGLNPQKQALECGVKFSGATVHFVNEELDSGEIILQDIVPVLEDDTENSLSEKILTKEHEIYPKAIQLVIKKLKQGVNT